MRIYFIAAVLSLSSWMAAAQTATEKYVLDLSKRKFDWMLAAQTDSLNKLMDDKIQYIHSNGWIQTKAEVVDDFKTGKLTYQKIDVKDSQARIYGNTAIVTGHGHFEGKGTVTFAMDLLYTEVYIKTGNHWKLASRHANKMP